LNYNALFLWFYNFRIGSDTPDHSTIAHCGERFEEADIYENSFTEVNSQLMNKGLDIIKAMIVDTSLVDKVYTYQKNRDILKQKQLKERIMHNNHPKNKI